MAVLLPKIEYDGAGGTLLTTVEIDQHDDIISGVNVSVSNPIQAQTMVFLDLPPDAPDVGRYQPPNRQLVVILTGTVEIEDSHGNTAQVGQGGQGEVVLVADTHTGHISRNIDKPVKGLVINLPDGQPDPQ